MSTLPYGCGTVVVYRGNDFTAAAANESRQHRVVDVLMLLIMAITLAVSCRLSLGPSDGLHGMETSRS
jgi:hypothetical protein